MDTVSRRRDSTITETMEFPLEVEVRTSTAENLPVSIDDPRFTQRATRRISGSFARSAKGLDQTIAPEVDHTLLDQTVGGSAVGQDGTLHEQTVGDTTVAREGTLVEGQDSVVATYPEFVGGTVGAADTVSKRKESGSRPSSPFWATVLGGVAIGALSMIVGMGLYFSKYQPVQMETALISVTAGDPAALTAAPENQALPAVEEQAVTQPVEPAAAESSGIVEHAQGRPVQVGSGRVKFLAGTQRSYDPKFVALPPGAVTAKSAQEAPKVPNLRPGGSAPQRFQADGGAEWQGGWTFENPQENVEIGSMYTEYLEQKFGANTTGNLMSFEPQPVQVLKNLKGKDLSQGTLLKYQPAGK